MRFASYNCTNSASIHRRYDTVLPNTNTLLGRCYELPGVRGKGHHLPIGCCGRWHTVGVVCAVEIASKGLMTDIKVSAAVEVVNCKLISSERTMTFSCAPYSNDMDNLIDWQCLAKLHNDTATIHTSFTRSVLRPALVSSMSNVFLTAAS